jgi:hypothetical protein
VRLTSDAAWTYLELTRQALIHGGITFADFRFRMRFLRDCTEPDSPVAEIAREVLEDAETSDEWSNDGERAGKVGDVGKTQEEGRHQRQAAHPNDPLVTYFVPHASTGLADWEFHKGDPDFFPTIPHGHRVQEKLDAYRGFIYADDRQTGRVPRRMIVALWNEEKFRSFAYEAIVHYRETYPEFRKWGVPRERILVLPRRRRV